jgi:uncharacterized circularly permuted ATP-grasp superfamily protein
MNDNSLMTTLSEDADPLSIRIEALKRVREQAEAAKEIQGEVAYFYSARVMNMEAAIRKEIQQAKQQRETRIKENSTIRQDAEADTNAPPEPSSNTPTRVPSREELFNMITYLDHRITPLNHALDDIQEQMKILSDRLKSLEQSKK